MRLPFNWKQGQHVAIIGRTGSGKSELTARLLPTRTYRIIIRTKPDGVVHPGAITVPTLKGIESEREINALVLEPPYERQAIEIWKCLEYVWRTGRWCVNVDELWYLIKELGLEKAFNKLVTQGRSKDITVVSGMQRPVQISRFAVSEATHVISFGLEGREIKTIEEATNRRMRETVERLRQYEFAWYYSGTREIWTGKLDLASGQLIPTDQSLSFPTRSAVA